VRDEADREQDDEDVDPDGRARKPAVALECANLVQDAPNDDPDDYRYYEADMAAG